MNLSTLVDIAWVTLAKSSLLFGPGFKVLALETKKPAAIRRQVSFCEAVYDKEITIEGVKARLITSLDEVDEVIKQGVVPVIIDPKGESIAKLRPDRKSTRLNSSHSQQSRMPSSA